MLDRRKRIYGITIILLITGFLVLTLFIHYFPDSLLDQHFSEEIQEHHNRFLDFLMKAISWFGYMPISLSIVLSTALIAYFFKYVRETKYILLTLLSGLVSSILKIIINRPRPTEALVHIIEKAKHQSFPSGHTVFYVTFFGLLILIMNRQKKISNYVRYPVNIFSAFLIFTIPISRIYLGAHWFTDVLAGFIVGMFCISTLGYFYLFDKKKVPLNKLGQS